MEQRSEAYFGTAVLLKNKKQYNASVVYFYFSIFQLMTHYLTIAMSPIPLDKQNLLKEDSHKWVLQEILNKMNNRKKETIFKEDFDRLSKLRYKADYQEDFVGEDECLEAEETYNRMKCYLGLVLPKFVIFCIYIPFSHFPHITI